MRRSQRHLQFRTNTNTCYPNLFNDVESLAILLHKVHIRQDINLGEFKYLLKKRTPFQFMHEIIEKLYYNIYFATDVLHDLNFIISGLYPKTLFYNYEEYCYEKKTCYPVIEMKTFSV